ncbi:MAG: RNA 2',3'-cyclic phosphodiesterase [Acidobacteria bacterium]|nr:MAG: RNA 2',3'-cyclic phosphodiesterase [Acidobacteriota bacterium]
MEEEKPIRSFICIELPERLRHRIGEIQAELKTYAAHVSWVRPQNIHLTLKFLGHIEPHRIPEILGAIRPMVTRHPPFTLVPEGRGVFPHTRSPRVFWLGIRDDSGVLSALQEEIERTLEPLGFPREKRPFTPHLTIGRVRLYRKPKDLTPKFLALEFSEPAFEVDHITLMRSDLKPTGAIYTPLDIIPLEGRLKREADEPPS